MGIVVSIKRKGLLKRIKHKLFDCPTFWRWKKSFKCPECKKGYRCYWDGNDVTGHGTDFCHSCAAKLEAEAS